MIDVAGITEYPDGLFLNTGTRHFVKFVPDVEAIDIEAEALPIRHDARFAPEGTNVNFVELGETIKIRTFEKGVEGETAACGTGITATAIACRYSGVAPSSEGSGGRIAYRIQAREATLSVDFIQKKKDAFSDVFLTGPAKVLAG
jgi:diaminopimelate epimerase